VEHVDHKRETQTIESPPADESYRTVSAGAVLALVLGLFSAVAFAHPLLLALPLVAIGLAIAALVRIAQRPGELIGRKAALIGLAAAVLFGCAAISYSFAREAWLVSRSRQAAEHFFSLLAAGKTHAAHQMTLMPRSRLPTDSDHAAAYANNPEGAEQFDKFVSGDAIERIRRGVEGSPPQYQGGRLANLEMLWEYIELDYLLNDGGAPQPIRVLVEFSRHPDTREEQWRVAQVGALE
jgi:hypothetical protein